MGWRLQRLVELAELVGRQSGCRSNNQGLPGSNHHGGRAERDPRPEPAALRRADHASRRAQPVHWPVVRRPTANGTAAADASDATAPSNSAAAASALAVATRTTTGAANTAAALTATRSATLAAASFAAASTVTTARATTVAAAALAAAASRASDRWRRPLPRGRARSAGRRAAAPYLRKRGCGVAPRRAQRRNERERNLDQLRKWRGALYG